MSTSYTAKDLRRIEDMIDRAYAVTTKNGKTSSVRLLEAANRMANAIKDASKAMRRARAAEEINYHDVAAIFYNRHNVLAYSNSR